MFEAKYLVYTGDNVEPKIITMAGVSSGHSQRVMEWKKGDCLELTPCDCGNPLPGQVSRKAANWAVKIMPSLFHFDSLDRTPKEYATSVLKRLIDDVTEYGVDMHTLINKLPKVPVIMKSQKAPEPKKEIIVVKPTAQAKVETPPVKKTPIVEPKKVEAKPKTEPPKEVKKVVVKNEAAKKKEVIVGKKGVVNAKPGSEQANIDVAAALRNNRKTIAIG